MSVDGIFKGTTGGSYSVATRDDPLDPGKAIQGVDVRLLPNTTASGTLTNAGDTVAVSTVGMGQVLVHLSGTYTAAVVIMELSPDGGTTWIAAPGYEVTYGAYSTGPTNQDVGEFNLPGGTIAYIVRTGGATNARVRLWSIGSNSVAVLMAAGPQAPNDPVVSVHGTIVVETGATPLAVEPVANRSDIATPVALASTAASQTLVAANGSRLGLILNNTDANVAYLAYAATASLAAFTASIPPVAADGSPGYWEMPLPIYTGEISVIWGADGSGSLIGSEL